VLPANVPEEIETGKLPVAKGVLEANLNVPLPLPKRIVTLFEV